MPLTAGPRSPLAPPGLCQPPWHWLHLVSLFVRGAEKEKLLPLLLPFCLRCGRLEVAKVHHWPCQDGGGHLATPGLPHRKQRGRSSSSSFFLAPCTKRGTKWSHHRSGWHGPCDCLCRQDGPWQRDLGGHPWKGPGPATKGPGPTKKGQLSRVFPFLKYVTIEVLPVFLIGLTVCLFSEPASDWLLPGTEEALSSSSQKITSVAGFFTLHQKSSHTKTNKERNQNLLWLKCVLPKIMVFTCKDEIACLGSPWHSAFFQLP